MPARSLYVVRPSMATGGADRVTLTLLRELDRDLFHPTLVLMRRQGELLPLLPSDVPVRSLEARSSWTAWLPLTRLLRRSPPDILLSTSSGTNLPAVLASLLARRRPRLVLSERNTLPRRPRLKSAVRNFLKRRLYPSADRVTAVSEGVKADMVRRLRLAAEKITVVSNPVLTSELTRLAAAEPDHRWFAEPVPVVLAAGRLVAAKGFDCLMDAFARLGPERRARLVILGEGPLRAQLENRIRRLGLEDRVSLPGFTPNPMACMSRCALFVLSSRREGLPGVLIQAMACGAPVIATDCASGPAEIITHGENGLLVPVDDSEALAESLEGLLDDPERRSRMAARGRLAVRRFSTSEVLPNYVRALLGEESIR